MFHYVIPAIEFEDGKYEEGNKTRWTRKEHKELKQLQGKLAYVTIIGSDKDPEDLVASGVSVEEACKFSGPFYLDFDNADDISSVLDDAKSVISRIKSEWEIPERYINIYLSGGKGVHILIPQKVFTGQHQVRKLPTIYKMMAMSFEVESVDLKVYNYGKGRMFRQEGIRRTRKDGSHTYKVGVSMEEFMSLDAAGYEAIVKHPRPQRDILIPDRFGEFIKAAKIFQHAESRARTSEKEEVEVNESVIAALSSSKPDHEDGCVTKLVEHGHQNGSNFNEAAMALAGYIAARFKQDEVSAYEGLVSQLAANDTSTSYPSEQDRVDHINQMLKYAYKRSITFRKGLMMRVIGTPCGGCNVCKLTSSEAVSQSTYGFFNKPGGTFRKVGEATPSHISTGMFKPVVSVYDSEVNGTIKAAQSETSMDIEISMGSGKPKVVEFPSNVWSQPNKFRELFNSAGVGFMGNDKDIQYLRALFSETVPNRVVKTNVNGILIEENNGVYTNHYVEFGGAIAEGGKESPYVSKEHSATRLLSRPDIEKGDKFLAGVIKDLFNVNEFSQMAATIGWFMASHFRQHFHLHTSQFPLLNLIGPPSCGKTGAARVVANLCGVDYTTENLASAEGTTLFPILKMLSTSTTHPRVIDEVNQSQIGYLMWNKLAGLLKASYNQLSAPRGAVQGKQVVIDNHKILTPICYLSEVSSDNNALHSRTLEVKFRDILLMPQDRKESFNRLSSIRSRNAMHSLAKHLMLNALNYNVLEFADDFDKLKAENNFEPLKYEERPRYCFEVALFGLRQLRKVLKELEIDVDKLMEKSEKVLVKYVECATEEILKSKAVNQVGRMLNEFDICAGKRINDDCYAVPGKDYYTTGTGILYINYTRMVTLAKLSAAKTRDTLPIRDAEKFFDLVMREVYAVPSVTSPCGRYKFIGVNLSVARDAKKIPLRNFKDCSYTEEI